MEKARREANEAFKHISLGQKRKACVTEKKSETNLENAKKRLNRLEKCKLEAQQAFGNLPLSTLTARNAQKQEQNESKMERSHVETNSSSVKNTQTVKVDGKKSLGRRSTEKSVKEKRKSISKGRQTRRSTSRRRSSTKMRRRSSVKNPRLTKVQASQLEALKSFGGKSLENIWKSNKPSPPAVEDMEEAADGHQSVKQSEKIEDSLEQVAKVASDESGGYQQDSDMEVVATSSRTVAESSSQTSCQLVEDSTQNGRPSDTEMKAEDCQSKEMSQVTDTSVVHVQNVATEAPYVHEDHMHTHHSMNGMSPIPEQSPPEVCSQSSALQFKSATPVESKPVTRLEKARLEALQSFNGQAFDHVIKTSTRKMARYLTPVKHQGTNTEVNLTRNTPSQTDDLHCKRHPRPNSSFYSNLQENSFCDRGALLESSKMVVLTARSLDTPSPECSPANL